MGDSWAVFWNLKFCASLPRELGRQEDYNRLRPLSYRVTDMASSLSSDPSSEMPNMTGMLFEELDHDNVHHSFKVLNKAGGNHHQFVVNLNLETLHATCGCQYFEFTGLICRHIMKVLVRQDVDTIPEHFILARWRKEANKFRGMDSAEPLKDCDGEHAKALRLNHMCQESTKLACAVARSKQAYLIYMDGLKELSKKVESTLNSNEASVEVPTIIPDEPETISSSKLTQIMLLYPNISQTKGRKKDVKAGEGKKICS